MKISKPFVIGLLGILTIALFIYFALFLKGSNSFKKEYSYYAIYKNSNGINVSAPILLNGIKIGYVKDVDFVSATDASVKMQFQIGKKYKIPENSVASIDATSLMSGNVIVINLGDSPNIKEPNSYFETDVNPSLVESFTPIRQALTSGLLSLDTILCFIKDNFGESSFKSLNNTVVALDEFANNLALQNKKINRIINSLDSLSQSLNSQKGNINNIIGNVSNISDSLAGSNIKETMDNLNNISIKLSLILDQLNEGYGSAGKLLKDETLYTQVNSTIESLRLLVEDIKENPKRYINVSVFGKKDKKEKRK